MMRKKREPGRPPELKDPVRTNLTLERRQLRKVKAYARRYEYPSFNSVIRELIDEL